MEAKIVYEILEKILDSYMEFVSVVEVMNEMYGCPKEIKDKMAESIQNKKDTWGVMLEGIRKKMGNENENN